MRRMTWNVMTSSWRALVKLLHRIVGEMNVNNAAIKIWNRTPRMKPHDRRRERRERRRQRNIAQNCDGKIGLNPFGLTSLLGLILYFDGHISFSLSLSLSLSLSFSPCLSLSFFHFLSLSSSRALSFSLTHYRSHLSIILSFSHRHNISILLSHTISLAEPITSNNINLSPSLSYVFLCILVPVKISFKSHFFYKI